MTCANRSVVAAEIGREGRPEPGELAVVGRPGEELVDGVQDLVAGPTARPRGPGHRHGHSGQDQGLGQHHQERIVADGVGAVDHGLGGGPGESQRQPVDRLAALARRQQPVLDGREVAHHVADPGAATSRAGASRT